MSIRAVALGLALGLALAATAYFNDWVIGQTKLISHHLPHALFGFVCVLLFAINPLARALSRRLPLSPAEVAVATAIALAACGWPSHSFFASFGPVVALPAHWVQNEPQWIESDVMSFVPGASGELAREHVHDGRELANRLVQGASPGHDQPRQRVPSRLWELMDEQDRFQTRQLATGEVRSARDFPNALNRVLARPDLYEPDAFADVDLDADLLATLDQARAGELSAWQTIRANRALLARALPEHIAAPPPGQGLLLAGGDRDNPTLDAAIVGRPTEELIRPGDIDWATWWPTIRLWGAVAVFLGLASLCLALIVHPQWSRREMLPYPVARFVQEISRNEHGGWLPDVARHRGFWLAATAIVAMHGLNGLQTLVDWLPSNLHIPLRYYFSPMRDLFPNASRVYGSYAYFEPFVFPVVIAFTLFLTTTVSFSLGIAHLLFMMLGAVLISQGVAMDRDYIGSGKVNTMAFGSFLALAVMILYVGRAYYANVAGSMLGRRRDTATPRYATFAGWGLVICLAGATWTLHTAGLAWPLGAALMLLILLKFLVMSRIVAETGCFLIKPAWWAVGILVALLSFEAVGPVGYIILALATLILAGETREAIMPYLTNGLKIAEQAGRDHGPRRIIPWKTVMIVASLLVAGLAAITIHHNIGLTVAGGGGERHSRIGFDLLAGHVAESRALETLRDSVNATGLDRLALISPEPANLGWMGLGFILVLVTAAARLRLPWWPLHPVIFLVWGTWPMFVFSFSFLLGWAIKLSIVKLGGARAYHAAIPIAVGVIFGELLSAFLWTGIGAFQYFVLGVTPQRYWSFSY